MSYCRFGEADIYLYPSNTGIVCCACDLAESNGEREREREFSSYSAVLDHVRQHQAKGHRVPDHAIERLKTEQQRIGDVYDVDKRYPPTPDEEDQ